MFQAGQKYKAAGDWRTLIESANKAEALQRMRTTPVLLMTTQRYFSMSVLDILAGSRIRRNAVIIDEKPIIKTVETVSRTDVNMVASALSDGLRSYDDHEEKRWTIAFWERIRSEFMKAAQDFEDTHIGETQFFAKYDGMPGLLEKNARSSWKSWKSAAIRSGGLIRSAWAGASGSWMWRSMAVCSMGTAGSTTGAASIPS